MTVECMKELNTEQRTLLVRQLRLWGDLNTDAILDPNCKRFSIPSIEGFIGYRTEMNCAVVFGDPVCSSTDQLPLVEAFESYCKEQGWDVVYTIVSEKFANAMSNKHPRILIQFGSKVIIDPAENHLKRTGSNGVLVRKKVKHAIKEGIVVKEYFGGDPSIENAIEELGKTWLRSRHGPQIFISHLSFFHDREGKRWFYAKQGDRVIGFLILNEIRAQSGWLLNNLIYSKDSGHGTSELLITTALNALQMEGCRYAYVGPITAKEIVSIVGIGKFRSWLIRVIFKAAVKLFHLDGQRIFWEKFELKYEPSYLIFQKINYRTIKALFRALNVGT